MAESPSLLPLLLPIFRLQRSAQPQLSIDMMRCSLALLVALAAACGAAPSHTQLWAVSVTADDAQALIGMCNALQDCAVVQL